MYREELKKQIEDNIQMNYNLQGYREAVRRYFDDLAKVETYGDILRITSEFKVSIDAIEAIMAIEKL